MRMFFIGLCDTFLILYLATLTQVSPFPNNSLTVDDYYNLKEMETRALLTAKETEGKKLELESEILKLEEEWELANKENEKAQAEAKAAFEKDIQKAYIEKAESLKQAEVTSNEAAKALKLADDEREKALQTEIQLSDLIKQKEESESLALQKADKAKSLLEIAMQNEQKAIKLAEEAKREAEDAKRKEREAKEGEARVKELVQVAQLREKMALEKEQMARYAESNALNIAQNAQEDAKETKTKIKTITQTADNAFNENVSDKLTQFNISIQYKTRWNLIKARETTLQGIPVNIEGKCVIFMPLDQIILESQIEPDEYITFDITSDNANIKTLYLKSGLSNVVGLAFEEGGNCSIPLEQTVDVSSYMPILLSIRNGNPLNVLDRIRGLNVNFFMFKRDNLNMNNEGGLTFNNKGLRGTGDYAEYIVKGDQIVDFGGNFIGIAYKKNEIIRINHLNGWQAISIDKYSASEIVKQMKKIINS